MPEFFETMEIPLLAGRTFLRRDVETEHSTAIVVNDTFARRYFDGKSAVGRTVDARFGDRDDAGVHDVVGVVADTRYDLRSPPAPTIYIPMRLRTNGTIHVRVAGNPATLASRLREEIRATNPTLRVTSITSQSAVVGRTLVPERLLALVLAAVGLYGVLSYAAVRRTREIGIRMALGGRRHQVVRTVLAEAAGATVVGAACGLAGALLLSRIVETVLFEVTPLDFWSLALPLGMLLLAALLAATIPALRVARVDPAIALRYE